MAKSQCDKCWHFWDLTILSEAGLIKRMEKRCGNLEVSIQSKTYLLEVDYANCSKFTAAKAPKYRVTLEDRDDR